MRVSSRLVALGVAMFLLAACDSPQKKEADYLASGKALYDKGDLIKAEIEFKNASQINPNNVEAQVFLGRIAEQQNDLPAAANAYRKAAANDPKNFEAQLKAGKLALILGDPATAKSFADTAISISGNSAEAHSIKAAALLVQNKVADAEKEAKLALDADPKSLEAMVIMAGVLVRNGKIDESVALIDRGLKVDAKSRDLLLIKLKLMFDQKRTDEVESVLRQLVALDPKNPAYVTDLANQLAQNGRTDEAQAEFKRALATTGNSDELVSAYAAFLMKSRSVDAAITEIKALIDKSTTAPKYIFVLEQLYLRANRLDEAIALMTDVKEKGAVAGDRLQAAVELARIAMLRNQRDSAEQQVADILKQDPANDGALLLEAVMNLSDGKFDSAITNARTVLNSNVNSIGGLTVLARAYAGRGDNELSISTLRRLLQIAPSEVDARLLLANMLVEKSPDEAVEQVDAVIALRPDAPELRMQKADFLLRSGKADKAELLAQDMLKDPGSAPTAHRLLGAIAHARKDYKTAITELLAADQGGEPFRTTGRLLVDSYLRTDQREAAEKLLQDKAAAKPDDATPLILLAALRANASKPEEAEQFLRKAIERQPKSSEPYLNLARLLTNEKRNRDAADLLKTAQAALPNDREVAIFAATALDVSGDFAAARDGYESVLRRWPADPIASNNLAALIADAWPKDDALLSRARQLAERFRGSDNPVLLDTLGWVLLRQGNFDDATILLQRSASMAKDNQQIQYHYAMALKEKGLTDKAKDAFAKALVGTPDYRGIDDARQQASTLK